MHDDKLFSRAALLARRQELRQAGSRVVFTNGCFDVLHRGHVEYLQEARRLGDLLVVGVNSDSSVRRLKGPKRPLRPLADRVALLCALQDVDLVTVFDETSVESLVVDLLPDVLVKGGDYAPDQVVGRAAVEAAGGRVEVVCHVTGQSTGGLLARVQGGTG